MTLKLDMKHIRKKGRRGLGMEQGLGWDRTPHTSTGVEAASSEFF